MRVDFVRVDLMEVNFVGVDLVGVDLMDMNPYRSLDAIKCTISQDLLPFVYPN